MNAKIILDVMIYVFSLLGGVVTVATIYKYFFPFRKVKWRVVEKGIKETKEKLIKDNFVPSLIVGIGRGGSIVGALLSGCLGHIPIIVIDRVYDWRKNGRHEKLFEEIKFNKNLEKVLLVAGELHTGETARTYMDYFSELGSKEIKVFSFWKESFPNLKPDYHCIVSDNPNLKLPWMLTKEYKRDSQNEMLG
jgi:probable phosphoglycerate mutase